MGSPKLEPCSHLANYKQNHGRRGYISLRAAAALGTTGDGRAALLRHRSPMPKCGFCSGCAGRLYLCLLCSFISCSDHAAAHSHSEPGHDISVDIERAELFCSACADQVYDPDFDSAVVGRQIADHPKSGCLRRSERRKRSASAAGSEGSVRTSRILSIHPWGLRGLNNLGNTCFMNSVLQVLLHTPPLRNYFLGDRHNRENCRMKRRRKRVIVGGEPQPCLACDVDGLFAEVFSGERTPYSPARLLYSWWRHSDNLANYEQQDAHEFFISMLDKIHEKEQASLKNKAAGIGDCHCIAHRVFSGVLRSDLTCTVCGFTSTTCDPCVDISLDMETCNVSTTASMKSTKMNEESQLLTLTGSLDLFTRPEKLGSDQKLYCQHCQVRQDAVKQMSIRRLPLVLCFHIKRFEHSLIRRASRKINRYLQFPFSLDMTPYLSSSIIRNRFGNRIFAFEGDESDISSELCSEYEVFAVVTHTGQLESGHYVTYLRLRNQWYKCDDAWITQVSEGVVRASQVYLMYYVQKVIYYGTSEDMDCLPVSPREWNHSLVGTHFRSSGCG